VCIFLCDKRSHSLLSVCSSLSRAAPLDSAWLRRSLSQSAPPARALLCQLAAQSLANEHFLSSGKTLLTLLGRSAPCALAAAAQASPSDGCLALYRVGESTSVSLLDPSLPSPPAAAAAPAARSAVQAAAAAAAAARALAHASGPQLRFSDLGGVDDAVALLRRLVILPLQKPTLFAACGLRPPRGVLLHGAPGTGKTAIARATAFEAGAQFFVISGPELLGEYSGESEARLRGVFDAAREAQPFALVFIDEIDALAPSRANHGGESGGVAARMVTQLLTLLDSSDDAAFAGVSLIAATNRPEALNAALRRPGRFDAEVELRAPNAAGRLSILESRLRGVRLGLSPPQLAELAASLHGFTGADCCALCAEASLSALRRFVALRETEAAEPAALGLHSDGALLVAQADFAAASRLVRPSGLRALRVEAPPLSCWDDVAGLADVKRSLAEALAGQTDAQIRLGVRPPCGVLLYGEPGTGKTSLARAAAAAGGRNFLAVSGADLYSMWVGASEKAVASVFAAARAAAPCVLFLDELDALAPKRGSGGESAASGGSVQRVLAQLLLELDGGAAAKAGARDVLLLAATNRPDLIDPALLRPGRIDRLLHVPAPRDAAERRAVLAALLRRTPLAPGCDDALDGMCAGTMLEGFTGADLSALVRQAQMAALEEEMEGGGEAAVGGRHFEKAAAQVGRSGGVSAYLRGVYESAARGV